MRSLFGWVQKRTKRTRAGSIARGIAGVTAGVIALMLVDAWRGFGATYPSDERLRRMASSKQWRGSVFVNPQPLRNQVVRSITGAFSADPNRHPSSPIPIAPKSKADFDHPPLSGLAVTWLGH